MSLLRKRRIGQTTQRDLAALVGISLAQFKRILGRGGALPKAGEKPDDWARRWHAFVQFLKPGKRGPAARLESEQERRWEEISRQALAETRIFDLQVKRGRFHEVRDCEERRLRQIAAVRQAVLGLGRKLARRLYQAPSPEFIQEAIDLETAAIADGFASAPAQAPIREADEDAGQGPRRGAPAVD